MIQLYKLCGLLMACLLTFSNAIFSKSSLSNKEIYSSRLANLDLPLKASVDASLERKIGQYVVHGGNGTELMLGRAEVYFPIFESSLSAHDLPSSLKYLPIAESLLRSRAVSSAKAAGLWQLMPGTARTYGLRVDHIVDERLDPHLSTEAAMLILKDLFQEFQDWNLVLAAYNCGSGRVRKAIRARGSRNYIDIKSYLPKETQKYVSAYLAAAYTANFYGAHGLSPQVNGLTAEPLSYVRVYRKLNLRQVAKKAGISYRYLCRLNPAFRQGYIPKNNKGYRLMVPHHAVYNVQQQVWHQRNLVLLPIEVASPPAIAYAKAYEYDPFVFLLGCKQQQLLSNNNLSWAIAKVNEMTNYFYQQAMV